MVVVHPDQVTVLNILDNGLRKKAVDLLVGSPGGLIECDLSGMVVEEGPEYRICESKLDSGLSSA